MRSMNYSGDVSPDVRQGMEFAEENHLHFN